MRAARQRRGWTRRQLRAAMGTKVSLQSLASYERGTRTMPAGRLVEVCQALRQHPAEVLARAYDYSYGETEESVWVDLTALASTEAEILAPLRDWAAVVVAEERTARRPGGVRLTGTAMETMAALCGADPAELVGALRALR
ncbi:MAG: helix-turn-helix domain-containing protein [Pseudonocardiaceae bacterium]|nr:helix-turn-helix domain-containing protein [Pseudonocardiaceae bacterium]